MLYMRENWHRTQKNTMEYDSYLILGRFWGMDQICTGKWDGFKKMVA